ncbi:hypothetical protein GY45DRAFT_1374450 [Cubamyces sp. BRFM 1775]|nr:hypothetical protein GY45DRAFT_1374450 [Cubamyces sp. BRFM 1775]
MYLAFLTAVLFASTAVSATDEFVVDTPAGTKQCVPTVVSWSDGTGPYFLVRLSNRTSPSHAKTKSCSQEVLAGGQPIHQFADIPSGATTFTWPTNVAAGTAVTLTMRDAEGSIAQTAPFVIGDGPSGCNPI